MPYDEAIDDVVANTISDWKTIRKKMFGGTCYLLNGNMLCGVYKDLLILRLGEPEATVAMKEPHVQPFDITGRPMKGWIMVETPGFQGDRLIEWLNKARTFVNTLPEK
jgi:hypothetical protein